MSKYTSKRIGPLPASALRDDGCSGVKHEVVAALCSAPLAPTNEQQERRLRETEERFVDLQISSDANYLITEIRRLCPLVSRQAAALDRVRALMDELDKCPSQSPEFRIARQLRTALKELR